MKHHQLKSIAGEGMPQYRNPFEKGHLIIKFSVTFPPSNWLPIDKLASLETSLPPREKVVIPDGADECMLEDYDANSAHSHSRHRGEVYDEDDDESGPGAQRVQCASQ